MGHGFGQMREGLGKIRGFRVSPQPKLRKFGCQFWITYVFFRNDCIEAEALGFNNTAFAVFCGGRSRPMRQARRSRYFHFSACRPEGLTTLPPMNLRLQNQLNRVGACITVAQSADHKPAWNGQPPADFGTGIVQLATDYGAVTAKAAQADGATGGAADAQAVAERWGQRFENVPLRASW